MVWKYWWECGGCFGSWNTGRRKINRFFSPPEERENHEDVVERLFYEETKFIIKYIDNEMQVPFNSLELIFKNKIDRGWEREQVEMNLYKAVAGSEGFSLG